MSKARSAATKPAKSTRSDGSSVVTWRAGADDLAAIDAVESWLKAESADAQKVTRSDAVRRALRLAQASIAGSAERDAVRDAARDEARDAARDKAHDEARRVELEAAGLLPGADQIDALLAQLKATEDAYRGFDKQVQRIGNNVNQMTIVAHSGGAVDVDAIAGVERALRAILDEMTLWERFDNRERMRLMYDRRT
jgi:hypothetical protein